MTQRYTEPIALERMSVGRCPECGSPADWHGSGMFRMLGAAGCSLRPDGVSDRIEQYRRDQSAGAS